MSIIGKRFENANFETLTYKGLPVVVSSDKVTHKKIQDYTHNYKKALENGLGFYLYGASGTGKTHLIACMLNYFDKQKVNYEYISGFSHLSYCRIEDFLIIDDANNQYGCDDTENYKLLEDRYNNLAPTIVVSKLPLGQNELVKDFRKLFSFVVDLQENHILEEEE